MHTDEVTTLSRNDGNIVLPAVFVDQVLYREKTGRYSDGEITEHIIMKVGRKYFEATDLRGKINIDSLMYESKMYSQDNCRLYRTRQEILDKNEIINLYGKIQQLFSHYSNRKFTLNDLRKVAEIVGVS